MKKRNTAFILDSIAKTHREKFVLLASDVLYDPNHVQEGKENTFFNILFRANPNCKTVVIDFDKYCIEENKDVFQNYPKILGESTLIDDYYLNLLKVR